MQVAFDHFNEHLFNNKLPQILFTTQRQHQVMGYFAPNRWASADGKKCHEIAINPLYVGRATLIGLMQTLVHEMVHCWQECFGKISRKSYHNKQWANKMISIGLMPSSTGHPGGAITGQYMSDYPAPKGKFIQACEKLLKTKGFNLPWVDRFAQVSSVEADNTTLEALEGMDAALINQLTIKLEDVFGIESFAEPTPQAAKKIKVKYTCDECDINVWGRGGLKLRCDECNIVLSSSLDL